MRARATPASPPVSMISRNYNHIARLASDAGRVTAFEGSPKKWTMISRFLPLVGLSAILIQGCRSYAVRSPATLISSATAIHSKREGDSVSDRVVDITPIRQAISRSTWHSDAFLDKGSIHLKFKNSPDIFVSFYGDFFWIDGQPGFYKIRRDDEEEFRQGMRRILGDG